MIPHRLLNQIDFGLHLLRGLIDLLVFVYLSHVLYHPLVPGEEFFQGLNVVVLVVHLKVLQIGLGVYNPDGTVSKIKI